ncbi:MAG: Serine-type D-Ala-D-Ala carboxypeptidase [Thermoleophilia bacterium]|nr:Serine-type D-Ala-D-Ala carboxypeptidase [Thermoleophilia bacterium]
MRLPGGPRTRALLMVVLVASGATGAVARGATSDVDPPTKRIERQLASDRDESLTDLVPPPAVTAKSWLVYDDTANEPIAAKDPATVRPIASLAKLMTALVVVDRLALDDVVTIPAAVNELPADASVMGARAGEKWPAGDLLRAMLGHSANDAAIALAAHVGDGDQAAFVDLMNQRADDLALSSSTFASPTGLDAPGAANTSTPIDLVALAETALLDADIRAAVRAEKVSLVNPRTKEPLELVNRNPLVGAYAGVDGVKTGFTDAAGYMFIAHHVDPETKAQLLVVTASSTSEATRASDAAALLDWARPLRSDLLLVEGGEQLGSIPVLHTNRRVQVFACDDLVATVRVGQRIEQEIVVPEALKPPISRGDEVGTLRVVAGAADVLSVPICSDTSIALDGLRDRLQLYAGDYEAAWDAGIDEVRDTWRSVRGGTNR